jgi:predicted nucleotidyltransferase
MISLPILWPQDKIAAFCEQWAIAELSLFGSILRDDFHNHSDVDLLVAFTSEGNWSLFDHIQMQQELATILQRNVDLVTKRPIERSQNPIRRHEILSTAQVIYTRGAYAPK